MGKFRYQKEHEQFVRDNCASVSKKELTKLFNDRFGTDLTVHKMNSFMGNWRINSGRTGYFLKGNKPWNYGTKGQGLTGPNKGSFKKGNVPANRKPLGSERVDPRDGSVLIKIPERDPHTGFPTRYKNKHVWVWEQANGPVPPGMVVAFIDGDRTNCEPENLMLISRAELLNLNRHGYKNMPDELKPSVLALSKLQVRTWAKEKKENAL
ncbi:MAG: HNH endonuclease signature motif containing protein [Thermodesulfobacteriota bacterium]|nr:HNH endonuclease signature motif containing protein [Thermodesulfobacteriota bacterium]